MNPEIDRQYVPEDFIQDQPAGKIMPKADLIIRRNGLDKITFRLVADTINAGYNMFLAQEAGDKEAEVLFGALIKWGGCRDDIYFACKEKQENPKLPLFFRTYYPEYLYFFAQDAKKNPYEFVDFSIGEEVSQTISIRKVDLLRLVLSYAQRPLTHKRIPTGM